MNLLKRNNRLRAFMITATVVPVVVASVIISGLTSKASVNETLDLSQKQLCLLANYVYFEGTNQLVQIQDKLDSMKKNGIYDPTLINSPASGIKDSKAIQMFKDIESDSILKDLVAVDSIDNNIRAVAFVHKDCINTKGAEAVVVYQGTKGLNEPWLDNLQGANETDTDLQLEAGTFFKKVENTYDVSYVTGHSKGGNMSQYATITQGINVRKCVSFDGQGFSELFINKYSSQLKQRKHTITSICSYKEPVHAMLTPIAQRVLLVKTDANLDPLSSHISSHLYNKSFFDANGVYKTSVFTEATSTVKAVEKLSDVVVTKMSDEAFSNVSEKVAPVLGYTMPIMQDAIANEDMPFIKALYNEYKKCNEDNELKTGTKDMIVSKYTVADNNLTEGE